MPTLPVHCLIVSPRAGADARVAGLLADAHALGLHRLQALACHDLFFIEGPVTEADRARLATTLLSDPVTQTAHWRTAPFVAPPATFTLEVSLRPGVTDPVADQIVRAAQVLGLTQVTRAATGQRYDVRGSKLTEADLHTLATRLLANPVIQRYALGLIEPAFPQTIEASRQVETIEVRELADAQLLALSRDRRAALDLAEMRAIQAYYRAESRDPTDAEFEMLAQTWSEHCVHKTFKARITIAGEAEIDGLLKTYLRAATEKINAPWVRSAFVDNAGIIDFDDAYEVSFKVETHNHPSAIEPFGGANTGVGGVIRDVLGVSAKPIAATDVLCFGPQDLDPQSLPAGVLHPRRIRSGVVAGVQDYGNKIGLPIVNGAVLYDPGYTANPLVFCGCVGLAPKNKHPHTPHLGDRIILLGGRTGRDGLRGATFSSMTMDAQTGEVAGASVQIGDPIVEKGLIEVITRARDLGLYTAITDCGAGGLSSAVGEITSQTGAEVDLAQVRLKYPGLAPWEIWLSEAQERMILAVPGETLAQLQTLCALYDVELTNIGAFTDTGRIQVYYGEQRVLDLAHAFLHDGIPQRHLTASLPQSPIAHLQSLIPNSASHLLSLLAHPNIASKAAIIRRYDHEVQGGTVVKPLTGRMNDGPADACVLKPMGTSGPRGLVLSNGLNPELGKRDAYRMAVSVVDEAIRNAVAVGADPQRIALLDNFCWGDPQRPATLGSLVEAARGCHDAALHYGTPFISGKDSLNNEYLGSDGQRHAIPPTLLISALGIIEDVNCAVTLDLKAAGNNLYLLGDFSAPPTALTGYAPTLYQKLHQAMQAGWVRACHDLSEGGLAVALAEMCLAGRLGAAITVNAEEALLFREVNACLLVEIPPAQCAAFEGHCAGLPVTRLGLVTDGPRLSISTRTRALLSLPIADLVAAWNTFA